MYINITPFFAHQIAPMDLSASVAEIGRDAGADTWRAACEAAEELQLLTTPEHLDTMIEFANSAGMDLQPEDCTPAMLNALFLQWIAGDLRQMGVRYSDDVIDWDEVKQMQEEGRCPSNICRGNDGAVYFYLGV